MTRSNTSLLIVATLFAAACGQAGMDSTLDGSKKKKHYVFACDGAAFDDSNPFGKRVTFAFEGKKKFKTPADFVFANEGAEVALVINGARKQCTDGAMGMGYNLGDGIHGVCIRLVYADFAYHTESYQDRFGLFKGNSSCSMKEKSQ